MEKRQAYISGEKLEDFFLTTQAKKLRKFFQVQILLRQPRKHPDGPKKLKIFFNFLKFLKAILNSIFLRFSSTVGSKEEREQFDFIFGTSKIEEKRMREKKNFFKRKLILSNLKNSFNSSSLFF